MHIKYPTFKFTTSSGFAHKGQENLQDFFASSQTLTVKFAPLTKSKREKYQFELTSTTQLTNSKIASCSSSPTRPGSSYYVTKLLEASISQRLGDSSHCVNLRFDQASRASTFFLDSVSFCI